MRDTLGNRRAFAHPTERERWWDLTDRLRWLYGDAEEAWEKGRADREAWRKVGKGR